MTRAAELKEGMKITVPLALRSDQSAALDPNGEWIVGLDHGDGTQTAVYTSVANPAQGWMVNAEEARRGLHAGWIVQSADGKEILNP